MPKSPTKYYKYRPLYQYDKEGNAEPNPFTQSIFTKGELWYAAPNSFNDPFDCKLRLHANGASDSEWEAYIDELLLIADCQSVESLEVTKRGKLWKSRPEISDSIGSQQEETNYDRSSVLCLSKRGNSIQMNSYYGDDHKGIAIEFEFSDEEIPCGESLVEMLDPSPKGGKRIIFRDVEYSDDLPELNFFKLRHSQQLVISMLFTKQKDWEPEDEFRIFRRNHAASSVGFEKRILKKVILGCKTGEAEQELVKKWLKDWPHDVILAKCFQKDGAFELEIRDLETISGSLRID
jgi:hypothetical protein